MRSIYKKTIRVIVWLGEGLDGKAEEVFKRMQMIANSRSHI